MHIDASFPGPKKGTAWYTLLVHAPGESGVTDTIVYLVYKAYMPCIHTHRLSWENV